MQAYGRLALENNSERVAVMLDRFTQLFLRLHQYHVALRQR